MHDVEEKRAEARAAADQARQRIENAFGEDNDDQEVDMLGGDDDDGEEAGDEDEDEKDAGVEEADEE